MFDCTHDDNVLSNVNIGAHRTGRHNRILSDEHMIPDVQWKEGNTETGRLALQRGFQAGHYSNFQLTLCWTVCRAVWSRRLCWLYRIDPPARLPDHPGWWPRSARSLCRSGRYFESHTGPFAGWLGFQRPAEDRQWWHQNVCWYKSLKKCLATTHHTP